MLSFKEQFYFLETVASVAVLGFADIVANVVDGVDNGPDALAVVGCDFLSTERVWGFIESKKRQFWKSVQRSSQSA